MPHAEHEGKEQGNGDGRLPDGVGTDGTDAVRPTRQLARPQAVEIRIAEGIRQWSNGERLDRHLYVAPSRVNEIFQEIYNDDRTRGLPAVESPYPYDLRASLMADGDGRGPMMSGTPHGDGEERSTTDATAEDGRGEP